MHTPFKKVLALVLILTFICFPGTSLIQAEETPMDYEILFKQVMDEIKNSYLYGDQLTEKQLFEAAMKGMFETLDPYSSFQTPSENQNFTNGINQSFVGIGVQLLTMSGKTTITTVFEGSPAQKAGVLKGDYFQTVDGVDVTKMPVEDLLKKVLGEAGTQVTIVFGRGTGSYSAVITRAKVTVPSVTSEPISAGYTGTQGKNQNVNQIGYIAISSFSETVATEFSKEVEKAKASGFKYVILDMRNNGGGYVNTAVELARTIIPAGPIVSFKDKTGVGYVYSSELLQAPFQIVALVNEYSASATEFVTGAIKDAGGIVVGETTYGKGVAQYLVPIQGDYTLKLTEEEFFTRNGNKVNGVGIVPNFIVEIPEFMAGDTKYYIYDKAKEIINLEKILTYLGYNVGTPDQSFDRATLNALKQFQTSRGLYAYGACDFSTQAQLNDTLQKSVWEKDPQLNKAVDVILSKMGEK